MIEYSNVDIVSSFNKNSPGSTKVITGFRKSLNNRIKNMKLANENRQTMTPNEIFNKLDTNSLLSRSSVMNEMDIMKRSSYSGAGSQVKWIQSSGHTLGRQAT